MTSSEVEKHPVVVASASKHVIFPSPLSAHVLYASETGTAEDVSAEVAETLSDGGIQILSYASLDDYPLAQLPVHASAGHVFIFVVSTCGDGEPPRDMRNFWAFFRRSDLPAALLATVRFAMFGLGDRAYAKFNAAARRLHTRFLQLGARPLLPIALGDDSEEGAYDAALVPWLGQLSSILCSHSTSADPNLVDFQRRKRLPRFEVTILDPPHHHRNANGKRDAHISTHHESSSHPPSPPPTSTLSNDLWCKGEALLSTVDTFVAVNNVITDPEYACADREVRHVELDLSHLPSDHTLHRHDAGDVLHMLPRNRPSAVDAFLALTGLSGDTLISVRPRHLPPASPDHSAPSFGDTRLNIRTPCLLRSFVSAQLDLWAMPRRRLFAALAPFATVEAEREKLAKLGSGAGVDDCVQYVFREQRTVLMVLRDFPSSRPPLDVLLSAIPRIRARAFSVASASTTSRLRVQVCVAVVRYTTVLRFVRVGLCSSFVARVRAGDVVPVWLERGSALRFRDDVPGVMVGTGTGVAPLRAFASRCAGDDGVERVLIYGCRHEQGDFLYREEWERMQAEGRVAAVVTAFSRMRGEEGDAVESKVYVQSRVAEMAERVWRMVGVEGGCVYVVGGAGGMPRSVREALVEVGVRGGELGEDEAERFVRRLEVEGRLQVECW